MLRPHPLIPLVGLAFVTSVAACSGPDVDEGDTVEDVDEGDTREDVDEGDTREDVERDTGADVDEGDTGADVDEGDTGEDVDEGDTGEDVEPLCGDTRLAPPSVALTDTELAVPIDVLALDAKVHLDLGTRTARVVATLTFLTSEEGGFPVFDLRQDVTGLTLDGEVLPIASLERHDFAALPSGGVLVLRAALAPCRLHHLVLEYTLAKDSVFLLWEPDAVTWSIGLSDIEPGGLLEKWFPVPLLHDTFAFHLSIDLAGPATDHLLLANAEVSPHAPGSHWEVDFPDDSDVMSPFFYFVPRRDVTLVTGPGSLIAVSRRMAPNIHLDLIEPALSETLADFTRRFGPRPSPGLPYLVVYDFMRHSGGMEYRNATQLGIRDLDTLRHEIAHTWFGRSLSPARHLDGWVDETLATWTTETRTFDLLALTAFYGGPGPRASLDPWLRATYDGRAPAWPYAIGPAVLEAIAAVVGRDLLEATLEDWARDCRGHHITQDDFREVLLTLPEPAFIDALLATWLIPPHEPLVHGTCPRPVP